MQGHQKSVFLYMNIQLGAFNTVTGAYRKIRAFVDRRVRNHWDALSGVSSPEEAEIWAQADILWSHSVCKL